MRVLSVGNMFPPHSHGGYEVLWQASVEHLRERGHAARVLTTDFAKPASDAPEPDGPDVHRELRWYWRDHEFPAMSPLAAVRLERHDKAILQRHVEEFRPDVIAWWSMGGMPLSLLEQARRLGIPAVGVIADDWLDYSQQHDKWLLRVRKRPWLFKPVAAIAGIPPDVDLARVARWSFISERTRQYALDHVLAATAITSVAPAGIPAAAFTPHTGGDWQGRLLYVGRLDVRKGIEHAINALAALPATVTLEVVGGGAEPGYLRQLEELAGTEGIAGRVKFAGELGRDGVRAAYAAADALVFPVTWPEPWGLVPLEAMACGTPVIATGTGGSGEYLEHERNCLIVEKGDPAPIAAAVARLAAEPALRATLTAGGDATAHLYTADRYNDEIMNELEAAIAAGPLA